MILLKLKKLFKMSLVCTKKFETMDFADPKTNVHRLPLNRIDL